ncbi:MAG: sulfatase [Candidatus Neomarinimicrobiota bacterium]
MRIIKRSSILFFLLIIACSNEKNIDKRPNIVWLVAEDLGLYIPSFGDSTISTPNLSRLAEEGVRYNNVYSVSGVCSPSRASIVTGMYPTSIGAHHMRTLSQQPAAKKKGLINYEVVPSPQIKMVSQILREKGYYCTNNKKEDYQFYKSLTAWDESSIYAHWRNRDKDQNFYSIFNFGVTHESNLWDPWYRHFDLDTFPPGRGIGKWWEQFAGIEKPLYLSDNIQISVPPYLPNNDIVRKDMKRMYSNIVEMDGKVGLILKQLEDDDLLEETIVVFYTDHGGPLPREKRLLYDSGIRVPMIIRYPNQVRAGEVDNQLISFVDFAPTLLSLANIPSRKYHQGRSFEGKYKSKNNRKYIHAAADRFDEHYDMIRAVRDNRYKYLKNFNPEKPYYLPLEYREKMDSMQELLIMNQNGQLDNLQLLWFRDEKPEEELFDTYSDPYELRNLADDPKYQDKLYELRKECSEWMKEVNDKGHISEEELIKSFWPNKIQPVTSDPVITKVGDNLVVSCQTEGANIGFKFSQQDTMSWKGWRPYTNPIAYKKGMKIQFKAHRIGYLPSKKVVFSNVK